jgi:hypothetical protein
LPAILFFRRHHFTAELAEAADNSKMLVALELAIAWLAGFLEQ